MLLIKFKDINPYLIKLENKTKFSNIINFGHLPKFRYRVYKFIIRIHSTPNILSNYFNFEIFSDIQNSIRVFWLIGDSSIVSAVKSLSHLRQSSSAKWISNDPTEWQTISLRKWVITPFNQLSNPEKYFSPRHLAATHGTQNSTIRFQILNIFQTSSFKKFLILFPFF